MCLLDPAAPPTSLLILGFFMGGDVVLGGTFVTPVEMGKDVQVDIVDFRAVLRT